MSGPQAPVDPRPLPPGWVQQWSQQYNQPFYVLTTANPPRSIWVHPLDDPATNPTTTFSPPPGPPPPQSGPQSQGGEANRGWFGGSHQSTAPQQPYGGYPQQGYQQQPQYYQQGPPQGYYPPQPQYQQKPQKQGMGMGTALLAGGAGLVGGALLMDAFEDHEDRQDQLAYDQGYQNGGGGDDYGNDNQGGFDDGAGGDF